MFQWLILHTVVTTALAGVVLAANRTFRLGPAARHLLWLAVLVKFLTPPVLYWPWALPTLDVVSNRVRNPGSSHRVLRDVPQLTGLIAAPFSTVL